jgi:hypothetical protein
MEHRNLVTDIVQVARTTVQLAPADIDKSAKHMPMRHDVADEGTQPRFAEHWWNVAETPNGRP